jgi:UDPglucose 6-dehydrogenase
MRISVIGLGKLGVCLAACFADRGFPTIGVDLNGRTVDQLNSGVAPVVEPRLQDLISRSAHKLRATTRHEEAIRETDVSFIIVPTPSEENGQFSVHFIRNAARELGDSLKRSDKQYHLFVITSTTSPGTSESYIAPLLESVSGRTLNRGFGLCYNPEFIALGNVVDGLLNPDLVLIGESDPRAGEMLEKVYKGFCLNAPRISRMSLVSAEIAKISLNSYVTMKISFANTLAGICERIPGADVDAICAALGADRRVSPYYLKGGLSFGGPCFPRDNRAFAAFARQFGCAAPLAEATDAVNRTRTHAILSGLLENAGPNDTVAVLGLAYKPNTPVVEESPGIHLVQQLLQRGFRVTAYDPLAMANARALLGGAIRYAGSVSDCLAGASSCVITTPAAEFKCVEQFAVNPMTVVDCWRFLDPSCLAPGVKYIAVGRSRRCDGNPWTEVGR